MSFSFDRVTTGTYNFVSVILNVAHQMANGDLWALLDFRTPTVFIDNSDAEFHPD